MRLRLLLAALLVVAFAQLASANSAAIKFGYSAEPIAGQPDKWNLEIHVINNSIGLRVCQFSVFHLDGGSTEFATQPAGWTHVATEIGEDGVREMIFINTDPSKKIGPKSTGIFKWEICSATPPKLAPTVAVDWKDIFGNPGGGVCFSQPVENFLVSDEGNPPESKGYVRQSTDPASDFQVVPDNFIHDSGFALAVGDEVGNPAGDYTSTLTSEPMDLSSHSNPVVQFQSVFRNEGDATARFQVSLDGGASWIDTWIDDSICLEPDPCIEPEIVQIPLSPSPFTMCRFEIELGADIPIPKTVFPNGSSWVIDDIFVLGDEQEPVVPVAFEYFEAERAPIGAVIRWGLLGLDETTQFELHRAAHNGYRIPVGASVVTGGHQFEWLDANAPAEETYYWLEVVADGNRWWHGPAKLAAETIAASHLELSVPAPNPFVEQTLIQFAAPGAGRYDLHVLDLRGRRVATLKTGAGLPGHLNVSWNGRDDTGKRVATGTYFLRVTQDGHSAVRKLRVQPR